MTEQFYSAITNIVNDFHEQISEKFYKNYIKKGLNEFQNHIDEKNVRQVLAYHYLSTKRTDLNIKRLIVYDATSDRALTINLD